MEFSTSLKLNHIFRRLYHTSGYADGYLVLYARKNRTDGNRVGITVSKKLGKSEYLPGGFFIYRAGEGEELISFNRELLKLYGFADGEEFRAFTGNSFRGMVHPDDLESTEKMISSQIEKENDIDSVEYRILCRDGSVKRVRDYGRFVHSEAYGDVFCVFLNDITESSEKE